MNVQLSELRMEKPYEDNKKYKKELKQLQYDMLNVQQHLFNQKVGLVLVFEGMDAAGKGGAIKRVTGRLDPRGLLVHPISAPQPHELRHHYLQRFWRKLPQHGQIGIFDRSWYGRVLVERIEGFATKPQWKRAFKEINDFEKSLTDESYIVVKCWLHITKEE
ncbi:MAG TPA: polyphosphate kinase, partial [Paenisporosarcina sp.]|nr:polyphosphate kinase [Paenisporosarcina sp.]